MSRSRHGRGRSAQERLNDAQRITRLRRAEDASLPTDPEAWPDPRSFEWLVDLSDYEEMIQSDSDLHVEWVRFVEGQLNVAPGPCGCNLCVLSGAA